MIRLQFADMALNLASRWLGDSNRYLAEDVVQEAFAEVYVNLASLRIPAAFPGWFRRIVYKHCDRITRASRPQVPLGEPTNCVGSPRPVHGDHGFVFSVLKRLPRPQQMVLTFYASGYSYEEIGALLDLPLPTVRKQLYEARQHLRRERDAELAGCLEAVSATDQPLHAGLEQSLDSAVAGLGEGAPGRRVVAVPAGHRVPSADGPNCVKINPLTNRIQVRGNNPGAVSVVDGDRNNARGALDMPDPVDIAVNTCANRIYVANYAAGTLAAVDGADHSIVATMDGYRNPSAVDVDAGADRVYLVHVNLVSILCAATNTTITLVPLPGICFVLTGTHGGFRVNPVTHRLHISHQQAGVVFVVEARTE